MKKLILLCAFISLTSAWANSCETKGPNVIFMTWDGIRSHEFFKGTGFFHAGQLDKSVRGEIFQNLWGKYAQDGMVLGGGNKYRIGSDVAVSLPSYQAMMAGESTHCTHNGERCPQIKIETMMETVRKGLDLPKKDVAVIASWEQIIKAAAKDPSNITHAIFPEIMTEGATDEMIRIQQEAMKDLPHWRGSRKDQYTFALGMEYLKEKCPRFMWISLVDSDEFAHEGDYPAYVSAMKNYDDYLDQLMTQLKTMGDYGTQTTVIVTTDHSRGAGPLWRGHGITKNSEKKVFLFATGRNVTERGHSGKKGNHLMLRPTIEGLLGLDVRGETLPGIDVNN